MLGLSFRLRMSYPDGMKLILLHLNSSDPAKDNREVGIPVRCIWNVDIENGITCIELMATNATGRVYVKESVAEVVRLSNEQRSIHVAPVRVLQ